FARAPRTGPLHRLRYAVGVISELNRGLSTGTQTAAADRVLRIAFELFRDRHRDDAGLPVADRVDVGVHHADRHAAAGAAQRTHAGFPLGDPRNDVVFGDEPDDLVLRAPAARQRRGGAGDRRQLDEVAAVHLSNDT